MKINKNRLICTENGSNKFWEAWVKGSTFFSSFGAIGAKAQTSEKKFDTELEAQKYLNKMVASKLKKGYIAETKAVADKKTKKAKPEVSLEEEFEKTFKEVHPKIQELLDEASAVYNVAMAKIIDLRNKAESLSKEHGIPFEVMGGVNGSGRHEDGCYIPKSFHQKFAGADSQTINEFLSNQFTYVDLSFFGDDATGWLTSSC